MFRHLVSVNCCDCGRSALTSYVVECAGRLAEPKFFEVPRGWRISVATNGLRLLCQVCIGDWAQESGEVVVHGW